jgi:radical SAM superfamily enzyme YgiQ (UPF0313 family)
MRITLISPYPDLQVFGLRTISACLKREGHDVHLLFLPKRFTEQYNNQTLNEVVRFSKNSNLIGISLMTNYFDNAIQITQKLKDNYDIPILWGGIHPSIRPEECLNYADMVCIGEGEEALVALSNKIESGQYYHVHGIWFKDKEKIIKNPIRPLAQSLDNIPFPDIDYRTHYILNNECIQKIDEELITKYLHGTYMTMPTRGCPFGCTYCCNNTINNMYPDQKPLRKRSINNIIEELVKAKKLLPFIDRIYFDDEAFFFFSANKIIDFCEKYRKNINLPLAIAGATPTTLTREKLSLLVDAGLNYIRIGIQSGSKRGLKLYNRRHTNQQVEKTVKIIKEFKDKIRMPQYDIILDNPWETDEDLIETLMFLSKLPTPYRLSLFSLSFYPGTELYTKAKKDGIIKDDLKDVYRKRYHDCKKTYLNNLFFLLKYYASRDVRVSPKIMFWLTNQRVRQLNIHWLLYYILSTIKVFLPLTRKHFHYLIQKGIKYIQNGN